jgi:hypothetical protein
MAVSVDFQRTTRRYIPEDGTLRNHRCENLKSYMFNIVQTITVSFGNQYSGRGTSDGGVDGLSVPNTSPLIDIHPVHRVFNFYNYLFISLIRIRNFTERTETS